MYKSGNKKESTTVAWLNAKNYTKLTKNGFTWERILNTNDFFKY